eukprot:10600134-Prorocentrum_lima.AAC.1
MGFCVIGGKYCKTWAIQRCCLSRGRGVGPPSDRARNPKFGLIVPHPWKSAAASGGSSWGRMR